MEAEDRDGTGRITEADFFGARRAEVFVENRRDRDGDSGTSPKMKNFINANMRIATDNWPSRKPCMKERLVEGGVSRRDMESLAALDVRRGSGVWQVSIGRWLEFIGPTWHWESLRP